MIEAKKTDVNKDLDNISEAGSIKDSDVLLHEGKNCHFNDDTEIEDLNTKATVSMEEKFEESEV